MECEEHLEALEQLPGGCIGVRKETAVHHGGPNCDRNCEFPTRPRNIGHITRPRNSYVISFYQHLIFHMPIGPLEKPLTDFPSLGRIFVHES